MTERPLVTVGGLIVAPDGDILLVRSFKWHDLYSVPGGKVEWGETREEAFIREIYEETRLKVTHVRFVVVQDCIFSEEFWQKKHFVMNDFVADLDQTCSKEDVQLNEEAHDFVWIAPRQALHLPLHHETRLLIEKFLTMPSSSSLGVVGVYQHRISCVIGVFPEERQHEQTLLVDVKLKLDFSPCLASEQVEDSVNYVLIAQLCTELAKEKKYFLLESFASDILDECLHRFPATWTWVCIQKPSAIPSAAYAFVELERYRG